MYEDILFYKRNVLKMLASGLSHLSLPVAFTNKDIPRVPSDRLSDGKKLKRDYAKSVKELNEEALKFAYKEK
ncbi:hypothetical protein [Streptococcus sciuri]|uniref:1-acyl-sn-glycerol-3-phosphate acyltransferase n=1 Tax=Streptococcus sciuri TaxID=2973939 RepID=A0ABT2F7E6_9STRE|nr:hypothetical protein [Streptococcus sciuri]MCS4488387.1 hypothetical protein [Streptococcus sciuri]